MTLDKIHDDEPNANASLKAEQRTDVIFDFELEDIIAGNSPDSDVGRSIVAIVDAGQAIPTEGKIETALLPIYESLLAEAFRQQGGRGEPPMPNRHHVRQHAIKVIQARKVKRMAAARATKPARSKPRNSNYTPWPQLLLIAGLLTVIVAVLYTRS